MLANLIPEESKFALIAVENAYIQLSSKGPPVQLSDGTWVLKQIPVEIDKGWKEWIGSLRYNEFEKANLVLIRAQRSQKPEILDAHHEKLGKQLILLFNAMHLGGVLSYRTSSLILGSHRGTGFEIRQMAKLPMFYHTKGYRRSRLTAKRIGKAAFVRRSMQEIEVVADSFIRLTRGWNVLMSGLQMNMGEERIHQFVRALEALISPDIGKTKKQFIRRCQTFTTANPNNDLILGEAFDLRSTCEHLNDWKSALARYPENERENVAFLRTRQMEKLACFAYSRILENRSIRNHFSSDVTIGSFWQEQDTKRMKMWGSQLDLTSVH